jgi:hypothetical protein
VSLVYRRSLNFPTEGDSCLYGYMKFHHAQQRYSWCCSSNLSR